MTTKRMYRCRFCLAPAQSNIPSPGHAQWCRYWAAERQLAADQRKPASLKVCNCAEPYRKDGKHLPDCPMSSV
jgi:hypothetical protein